MCIEKILNHLDGFILKSEEESSSLDSTFNKMVTIEEVLYFLDIAKINTLSFLNFNDETELNTTIYCFIYMWCAGLIYKKYDVKERDLLDETQPIGYGDQLIINAKTGLKPFKKYKLSIF